MEQDGREDEEEEEVEEDVGLLNEFKHETNKDLVDQGVFVISEIGQ